MRTRLWAYRACVPTICLKTCVLAAGLALLAGTPEVQAADGAKTDAKTIYNFKKEYDLAIAERGQAVKLGPSADATVAGGSERLGKNLALSGYYTERGFAHFRKDNAIRLNPHNGKALKTRGQVYEAKGDFRAEADLASAELLGE